jgi:hypothetical protein
VRYGEEMCPLSLFFDDFSLMLQLAKARHGQTHQMVVEGVLNP